MRSACLIVTLSASALASPRLEVNDANALARGNALTAHGGDAMAAQFNPAGLIGGEGTEVRLGVGFVASYWRFTATDSDSQSARVAPMLPVHVSVRVAPSARVAFGLSFSNPYGQRVLWPEGWSGALEVQEAALESMEGKASLALAPHPRVALGVSATVLGLSRSSRHTFFALTGFGGSGVLVRGDVTSEGLGVGVVAGLRGEVLERRLWVGALARFGYSLPTRVKVTWAEVPPNASSVLVDSAQVRPTVLPPELAMGALLAVSSRVRLSADARVVLWNLAAMPLGVEVINARPSHAPLRPSLAGLIGVEADVTGEFTARAGASFESAATVDGHRSAEWLDLPTARVSMGAGWRGAAGFGIDVAYEYSASVASSAEVERQALGRGLSVLGLGGQLGGTGSTLLLTFNYRR